MPAVGKRNDIKEAGPGWGRLSQGEPEAMFHIFRMGFL